MENWPDDLKYLGTETPRVDGPQKVTGKAKYASDIQLPGLLFGMMLRSPWPAARLTAVDLEPARRLSGIKAAILIQDVPRDLFYYGEEIAAVAGTSREVCEEALANIVLEATPKPFVVNEREAINPDEARVFPDQYNVSRPREQDTGDVDAAFATAAAVVEEELATPVQFHQCLEPHGNTARMEGDELTVWASTQGIFANRDGISDYLEMDQSKVRVLCEYMGGGFGSKLSPGVEAVVVSVLSQVADAPVKMILSRFEEFLAVGNRPSVITKVKLGADAGGNLIAYECTAFGTGGFASGGTRPGGGGGTGIPAPYIYTVPNVRTKQYGVAVNAGSGRPMRAPGHPQGAFVMEALMDDLAVKLELDPLDFRLKNTTSEVLLRQFRLASEKFRWKERYQTQGSSVGVLKTGVGCAGNNWGVPPGGTRAEVQVNPDGTVEARCGTQDIGTGTTTLIAVVAAEALGLSPDQITPRLGDSRFPPSGGSGGSTTAPSVSPAIYDACLNAIEELKNSSGMDDVRGENWKRACSSLGVTPIVAHGAYKEGYSAVGAGGVQMVEVEVDTETGFVKVKEVVIVQDCGLVVNKLTAESQANGGIIMGIGYALYEQRFMDDRTGFVLNPNFETYKLPGAADIPEIKIFLINMPERGVIGIGEPVTIPTAAAISNAVANALGVRVTSLPITPPKVLATLGKVPNVSTDPIQWDMLSYSAGS